jgi:hypothetical protein
MMSGDGAFGFNGMEFDTAWGVPYSHKQVRCRSTVLVPHCQRLLGIAPGFPLPIFVRPIRRSATLIELAKHHFCRVASFFSEISPMPMAFAAL